MKTEEKVISEPMPKRSEKEQDLLKKIAYHEAYSAGYKLKLAKILVFKGAKAASKAAVKGGKFIKGKMDASKEKKQHSDPK